MTIPETGNSAGSAAGLGGVGYFYYGSLAKLAITGTTFTANSAYAGGNFYSKLMMILDNIL